jgi:acetyl-CoA carboxylase biotin carboxyl carrier protein
MREDASTTGGDVARIVSQVRAIVDLFESKGVARLRLRWGGLDLELEREPANGARRRPVVSEDRADDAAVVESTIVESAVVESAVVDTAAVEPVEPPTAAASVVEVRAPLVGVFYRRPAPESPPFVEVGQRVEVGQQVAVVEAMKMFNSITTPVAGLVVDIPVGNGDIVEFDQVLVTIQP